MAAVVSHAMRRFPPTPPDVYSSYELRDECSNQVWAGAEGAESALARSMRYANPWLYGSVRAPAGLLLTPAFVLCACPDYLNGTKRSSKKSPVVCKKCKGTRLTVTPGGCKFGTVRCYPTAVTSPAVTPLRAGTVRVSSSSRPSILPSADPYDLMRRSRLAVQDSSSQYQFRTRSTSPDKTKALEQRSLSAAARVHNTSLPESSSTSGRRSILECNINPYELVASDFEIPETDIKLVNGQRIRVSAAPSQDYEDVQPKHKFQCPVKGQRDDAKNNEKESDNRFKSILKKPTTTFSDTDSSGGPERSPSPAQKSGSHFYLPLPANAPRKKVQFLVENKLVCQGQGNRKETQNLDYEELSVQQQAVRDSPEESYENSSEDDVKKPTTLRRSISERFTQEPPKVVFHDTTALRFRTTRTDSRTAFAGRDLERLDGINNRVRHGSPTRMRPRKPPPPPPAQCVDITTSEQIQSSQKLETLEKPMLNDVNDLTSEVPVSTILENESPKTHRIVVVPINVTKDAESAIQIENITSQNQDPQLGDAMKSLTPLAPPRKRSHNKSPSQSPPLAPNVQIQKYNHILAENTCNKVTVQISPTKEIHKIQIKNEFVDAANPNVFDNSLLDNSERKTSILINGDDCYCTVNVNDNVPLYQSSVVVKDSAREYVSVETSNNSSSVYITGNFSSTVQNNLEPKEEKINKDNQVHLQNSKETEDKSISLRETAKASSNAKEIENKVSPKTEQCIISNSKSCKINVASPAEQLESTQETLTHILNDPVEAVRRNLVPHVCGKSDMTRTGTSKSENSIEAYYYGNSLPEEQNSKTLANSLLKLNKHLSLQEDDGCSEHSSSTQYEMMDACSDCYTDNSNRSSVTEEELNNRTKFYELLAESALVEVGENEDHHYESIQVNSDPIYEEIEVPPPLPVNPPPTNLLDDLQLDKEFTTRSIFEGASKYDILSYLVDAKERGIVQEDTFSFNFNNTPVTIDEVKDNEPYNRVSHISTVSDSSEDSSLTMHHIMSDESLNFQKTAEVERNDSGVGSETSKSSLSKYRTKQETSVTCEDCEIVLDYQTENEPLICRKCAKKRSERKEIITEIVETEEKYSRDLQIILEEFYQPMLVAGLLTPEQLSAIFLNVEELLENSQALAERLRDAVEIAAEQGDEDLLTVNMGKLFLEAAPMLHAFASYCVRQGAASLLLASLEKDKELLRIFLRVSQMENTLLRRMNLNSFLMVPVQRVTKYPLLLARLYKVTPVHHETREQLKDAQSKIELHLSHMNSETKDVPSKLWRRIGNNSGRRSSAEMDLVNIKLRKIAVDVLEWNHDEAKFTLEGKLLYTQPTDNNWRKGRTIKLTPINALLVTNGKVVNRPDRSDENGLIFSRHSGVREAALLLVRDKNGRYSLLREPLYLDRCVIAADPAWQSYFEVQELLGKDTFIFKAEDDELTRTWYRQLQHHAQGLGTWRKRRNALANIMINGMGLRS